MKILFSTEYIRLYNQIATGDHIGKVTIPELHLTTVSQSMGKPNTIILIIMTKSFIFTMTLFLYSATS